MFKCSQCQSENIRFMTSVILSAPIKYYHNLVKEAYTDKDTIIWGVNWDHDIMLSCADCGKVLRDRHTFWKKMDELSDEVKRLKAENERLDKRELELMEVLAEINFYSTGQKLERVRKLSAKALGGE